MHVKWTAFNRDTPWLWHIFSPRSPLAPGGLLGVSGCHLGSSGAFWGPSGSLEVVSSFSTPGILKVGLGGEGLQDSSSRKDPSSRILLPGFPPPSKNSSSKSSSSRVPPPGFFHDKFSPPPRLDLPRLSQRALLQDPSPRIPYPGLQFFFTVWPPPGLLLQAYNYVPCLGSIARVICIYASMKGVLPSHNI